MKWHMEWIEIGGEKYPHTIYHGDRRVICADAIYYMGVERQFLDMPDAEVAEVLEKLNSAEGEA